MEIREYTNYKETEILRLYNSVGWTAYTDNPETLRLGFKNSLRVLAAYEGEELLGLIRAVGDGYTILYIQDILAFPEHQREGIGSALIKALIEQFSKVRQIVLSTDAIPKNIAFYFEHLLFILSLYIFEYCLALSSSSFFLLYS